MNNFELQNHRQKLIIEHWITPPRYGVLDERFLKKFMTNFQTPTPITLRIIGFWTEITQYINLCNILSILIYVKSNLVYASNFQGILFIQIFAQSRFCGFCGF